jgi:hypothetical protein
VLWETGAMLSPVRVACSASLPRSRRLEERPEGELEPFRRAARLRPSPTARRRSAGARRVLGGPLDAQIDAPLGSADALLSQPLSPTALAIAAPASQASAEARLTLVHS